MSYKSLIISILISNLLIPSTVMGLEEYLTIDCNKIDSNTECSITGTSNYYVSAIEYKYELPKDITIKGYIKDSSWEGENDENIISLYTDENKIGNFSLGKLILSSKRKITNKDIKSISLKLYDENFEEHIISVKDNENDVNEVKSESNNIHKYVIIIIGIVISIAVIVLILKKGAKK